MEKIRYGLIGYGKVARLHALAIAGSANGTLISVAGRTREKRDQFAREWNITSRESANEMKALDGVDAVIITSPHPSHCEESLKAFSAGCHVLVEKPMALTVEECDRMISAAQATKLKLGVVSQRRWYPSCQRIKKAIMDGKIGNPSLAQVTLLGWRDEAYCLSDPWRGKWDTEGGGVLINQAPHQLDILHHFIGLVEGIQAYWGNVNHPYIEVDDTASAIIRFGTVEWPPFSYRIPKSRESTPKCMCTARTRRHSGFRLTEARCLSPE